jgi:hypothetical protein
MPSDPEALAASIIRGITGTVLRVSKTEIAVRDLGEGSGGQSWVPLAGGPKVPVTGEKTSWMELRRGDMVAVSFTGDPPRALGIQVLPLSLDPVIAAAAGGRDPYKKGGREFIGWIKQIDDETMAVRTPDGPPGTNRRGEVKLFARQDGTEVELLRDSWEDLRKGDRVSVEFQKGEPRPADKVKVILRGGEKPLPRGLATRLFDPAYDKTVADVDGIGEWPPDKPWPPPTASGGAARSEP